MPDTARPRPRQPAMRTPSLALLAVRQRWQPRTGPGPTVQPSPRPDETLAPPSAPITPPAPIAPSHPPTMARRLAAALGVEAELFPDAQDPSAPGGPAVRAQLTAAWLLFLLGHEVQDAHLARSDHSDRLQLVIDRPEGARQRLARSERRLQFQDMDRPETIPAALADRLDRLDLSALRAALGPVADPADRQILEATLQRLERTRLALDRGSTAIERLQPADIGPATVDTGSLPPVLREPRSPVPIRPSDGLQNARPLHDVRPSSRPPLCRAIRQLCHATSRDGLAEPGAQLVARHEAFVRSVDAGRPDGAVWLSLMASRRALLAQVAELQAICPEPGLERVADAALQMPVAGLDRDARNTAAPLTAGLTGSMGRPGFPWPKACDESDRYRLRNTLRSLEACWSADTVPNGGSAERPLAFARKALRHLDELVSAWEAEPTAPDDHLANGRQAVQRLQTDLQNLLIRLGQVESALRAATLGPSVRAALTDADLCAVASTDLSGDRVASALQAGWPVKDILLACRLGLPTACMAAATAWRAERHDGADVPLPEVADLMHTLATQTAGPGLPPQAPPPRREDVARRLAWELADLPGHARLDPLAVAYEALLGKPPSAMVPLPDTASGDTGQRWGGTPVVAAAAQTLQALRAALAEGVAALPPGQHDLATAARQLEDQLAGEQQRLGKLRLSDAAMDEPPELQAPASTADWLRLLALPGMDPDYAAAGLQQGWSPEPLMQAHRLGCAAWTLPLGAHYAVVTGLTPLDVAWRADRAMRATLPPASPDPT